MSFYVRQESDQDDFTWDACLVFNVGTDKCVTGSCLRRLTLT